MIGKFYKSHDTFHDVIKFMVGLAGSALGYDVEFEDKAYQDLEYAPHRPDVILTRQFKTVNRKDKVFVEVQALITPDWLDRMSEQYKGQDYLIIPLKRVSCKYTRDPKKYMGGIYQYVYDLVSGKTELPKSGPHNIVEDVYKPKVEKQDKVKELCEWCNKRYTNLRIHRYRCKKRPAGEPR